MIFNGLTPRFEELIYTNSATKQDMYEAELVPTIKHVKFIKRCNCGGKC